MNNKNKVAFYCLIITLFLSISSFSIESLSLTDKNLLKNFFNKFYQKSSLSYFKKDFIEQYQNYFQINNIFTQTEQLDFYMADILFEIKNYIINNKTIDELDNYIDLLSLKYFLSKDKIIYNKDAIITISSVLRIVAEENKIITNNEEILRLDQLFTIFFSYIINNTLKKIDIFNNIFKNITILKIKKGNIILKQSLTPKKINIVDIFKVKVFFYDHTKIAIDTHMYKFNSFIAYDKEIKNIKLYYNHESSELKINKNTKKEKEMILNTILGSIRIHNYKPPIGRTKSSILTKNIPKRTKSVPINNLS